MLDLLPISDTSFGDQFTEPMETLPTAISPNDPEFLANKQHNQSLAQELKKHLAYVREGGGEKYRKRHEEQGKLFVRERIEHIGDSDQASGKWNGLSAEPRRVARPVPPLMMGEGDVASHLK